MGGRPVRAHAQCR